MAKKEKESPHVTQSQWVEGMEMIKEYFGTLFISIQKIEVDQRDVKGQLKNLESGNVEIKQRLGALEESNTVIKHRLENVERDIGEVKKNVEMNTESLNLLSKQQQETQKMEFDIFKQGERITKLEKVR